MKRFWAGVALICLWIEDYMQTIRAPLWNWVMVPTARLYHYSQPRSGRTFGTHDSLPRS